MQRKDGSTYEDADIQFRQGSTGLGSERSRRVQSGRASGLLVTTGRILKQSHHSKLDNEKWRGHGATRPEPGAA